QKADQLGMAPVAVARQAHRLPCRTGFRQLRGARNTALGIETNRDGLAPGRAGRGAKDTAGQRGGCRGLDQAKPGQRQHGGGQEFTDHCAASPFALTQISRTSARMNITMSGEMPSRWFPVTSVTVAISSGARNAVALPDSAYSPKASVARSGVVWRTIIVRLADCSAPPAPPISAPQRKNSASGRCEPSGRGRPMICWRLMPVMRMQTPIRTSVQMMITGLGPQRRSARPPIQLITAAETALTTPKTPARNTGQPSTVPA